MFNNQNNLNYIPCINCNNMVNIEEIGKKNIWNLILVDSHSNFCTQVKDEVILAETSHFSYHAIEYKIKKLLEHVNLIKNSQLNLSKI